MRSTIPILICCLYALSAVDANPFSKSGNAEVQQGNAKASKSLNLWSDDKSDDDDKDDKWSKDDDDGHYGGSGHNNCASHSVSVLIGTSTYAMPCLQGRAIVNLNGLIPNYIVTSSITSSSATEASSSAVSSSTVNAVESSSVVDSSFSAASSSAPNFSSAASSSETSSASDSTTTTTDTTTTTTYTSTSADSEPTFAVTFYGYLNCTGSTITTSLNSGCFNYDLGLRFFSAGTTSTTRLKVDFYSAASCAGNPTLESEIDSDTCGQNLITNGFTVSYSVTTV